jgi:hypothetical protein
MLILGFLGMYFDAAPNSLGLAVAILWSFKNKNRYYFRRSDVILEYVADS